MAKSDQLIKWIASKEATISKKQETNSKRVARIEKLKQEFAKQCIHVTNDDLHDNPYNAWRRLGFENNHPLFDKFYSMHDATEQNTSAEKEIIRLEKDLEQHKKELSILQDKTQAAAGKYDHELEAHLIDAFKTSYEKYRKFMIDHHVKKWKHYHERKDEWKARRTQLRDIKYFGVIERNRIVEELNHINRLLADTTLGYDNVDDYMNTYIIPSINDYWKSSIKVLVTKCADFHINKQLLQTSKPQITDKGFEVVITDGGSRQIYARLIWAAENSLYVTPHFRYIVTERH